MKVERNGGSCRRALSSYGSCQSSPRFPSLPVWALADAQVSQGQDFLSAPSPGRVQLDAMQFCFPNTPGNEVAQPAEGTVANFQTGVVPPRKNPSLVEHQGGELLAAAAAQY